MRHFLYGITLGIVIGLLASLVWRIAQIKQAEADEARIERISGTRPE